MTERNATGGILSRPPGYRGGSSRGAAVIWRGHTEHARAEVWHQPVSNGGARFAIVALRKGAPLRRLYQAYFPECGCAYERIDYASVTFVPGKGYTSPKKAQLPREVCRRGVAVIGGNGIYPTIRGRCPQGNPDNQNRSAVEHRKSHCHGGWWDGQIRLHRGHAIEAAQAVLDSYGPRNRRPLRGRGSVGVRVGYQPGTVKHACELFGIDHDEFQRQLAAARAEKASLP